MNIMRSFSRISPNKKSKKEMHAFGSPHGSHVTHEFVCLCDERILSETTMTPASPVASRFQVNGKKLALDLFDDFFVNENIVYLTSPFCVMCNK